jgi:Arc/MetJ-type ribon-helix-helix transcriptional regulator
MTIEIAPELEEIIQQRLDTGKYRDVADVLEQAVLSLPTAGTVASGRLIQGMRGMTGADLVAVMQRSPHKEIELFQSSVSIEPHEIREPVEF